MTKQCMIVGAKKMRHCISEIWGTFEILLVYDAMFEPGITPTADTTIADCRSLIRCQARIVCSNKEGLSEHVIYW